MQPIFLSEATNQQINWLVAQKEGLTVVVDNGRVRFPPGQFSDEELYDPCWGVSYLCVVNSLTARDGIGYIELESLYEPTKEIKP